MLDPVNWTIGIRAMAGAIALGYLLGSIPFGLLITRLTGGGDIRAIGSGNIGATNVLRTGRKGLAALTLLGDALKGTAAVLLARYLWGQEGALLAGLFSFLGHLFPVWLGFKGGKGVSTYIGLLLAMAWPVALAFCAIWLLVAWATRYSSLSALVASAISPAILWAMGDLRAADLFFLLTLFLWLMHRENIGRLIRGGESRIGESKNGAPTALES